LESQSSPLFLRAAWHAVLAFLILGFAQVLWGAILNANLTIRPGIPWSVGAMAPFLWLFWWYLGGWGWPRSTAEERRRSLRANPVSIHLLGWALLSGALAIVALAGAWIIMFQLFPMTPNVLPDTTKYPIFTLAMVAVMASLVSPISEEAAFRGYFQGFMERHYSVWVSILSSSFLFALAHLTQGFWLPKLFVYFLVGITFGVIASLANSILASIPVQILGDLTFFTLVWPNDAARRLISNGGADGWFWIHVAQAIVFTFFAILAFRAFAKTARRQLVPAVRELEI
jgi:membrane protease YdiL (CAAX protease family)